MIRNTGHRNKAKSKNLNIIGTVTFLIIITISCMGYLNSGDRITNPADFSGFITRIQASQSGEGVDTIFVESNADKLVHRCVIKLTSETLIFRKNGDTFQPVTIDQLLVQDLIQVWFKGKYKNKNPFYGEAKQIVVIDHY